MWKLVLEYWSIAWFCKWYDCTDRTFRIIVGQPICNSTPWHFAIKGHAHAWQSTRNVFCIRYVMAKAVLSHAESSSCFSSCVWQSKTGNGDEVSNFNAARGERERRTRQRGFWECYLLLRPHSFSRKRISHNKHHKFMSVVSGPFVLDPCKRVTARLGDRWRIIVNNQSCHDGNWSVVIFQSNMILSLVINFWMSLAIYY